MARIRTKILIPAYMNASRPYEVEAYQTHAGSRFAVAKVTAKAWWDLRHVKSGLSVGSLLPPQRLSLSELLGVVRAIEARSDLDLSLLDEVEFGVGFNPVNPPPHEALAKLRDTLRDVVAAAVGVPA